MRAETPQSARDVVILLHGMLATGRSMEGLASLLKQQNYVIVNWTYRSLWYSIATHAERLRQRVDLLETDEGIGRIHFVTHSMGGIIARCALQPAAAAKVGRMVMLAPPNTGSRLTRLPSGPLGKLFPPISELSEACDSFVNSLPEPVDIEVGIIAAAADRIVDLANTRLKCQRDHVVLPGSHQGLPSCHEAGPRVLHFLQHGRFEPDATGHARRAA